MVGKARQQAGVVTDAGSLLNTCPCTHKTQRVNRGWTRLSTLETWLGDVTPPPKLVTSSGSITYPQKHHPLGKGVSKHWSLLGKEGGANK